MSAQITNTDSVEEAIRKHVAENLLFTSGSLPIGDEDSFIENSVVDSTGVLDLVLFVESRFGIAVTDRDVIPENFDSVSSMARYIRGKFAATPSA